MNQTAKAVNPKKILDTGFGFWGSKVLLSAVELEVFTALSGRSMTAKRLGQKLGLHERGLYDFFDTLVSMGFLERDGDGPQAEYRNTDETAHFLDKNQPQYIGGILEMSSQRLFKFWHDLPEALRTGKPQNEIKHSRKPMFEELYEDLPRLEQFMGAMTGISRGNFIALAEKYDFSKYQTLLDVGGATGILSIIVAQKFPHLKCISFDLAQVLPIAQKHIAAAGLTDRIQAVSGDFFKEPLPKADCITMGMILHDWNAGNKKQDHLSLL